MIMPDQPLPRTIRLGNGVLLHLVEGRAEEALRIDFLFSGGYGVQRLPLQALFTNRMLREGTADYTASEISRRLDYYGAWLEAYVMQGCNRLTMYSLGKHVEPMLDLLESMVKRPLFPQKNLSVVRNSNKAFYKINSRKVETVAQRHFENMLWGEAHPLGHIVCAEDYDAITRDSLVEYHNSVYSNSRLEIFLTGKLDDRIVEALDERFGDGVWGGPFALPAVDAMPAAPIFGRRNVALDGTLQSGVKVGFMALDSDDEDYFKFRFLTVLLGGYFGSRLMSNIREEKGYTYHIEAEIDAYGKKNAFMITTETANGYVERLLGEVSSEIELLRDELVGESELELVRNYTLGELCREYEGAFQKTEAFISVWQSGQPFSALNDYLEAIRTVTAEELRELARKYLVQERMSTVVAGM
ncbi:MAG: insulinase family protein [Bacteroidaceae bacterium]|nr:insulinase family protein [Bacteroidaceae bacterium]